MSYLKNLLNPPPVNGKLEQHYDFFNSVNSALNGLTSVRNPSVVTNANFATLSAKGLTPTTQADGDGEEFIGDWQVFGASNAVYTITPTPYAVNSTIKSASPYFVDVLVTSTTGAPFYFYQRQIGTIRQYQQDYLTYNLQVQNNQSKAIKLRMDVFTFYDTTSKLTLGSTFFLQPGLQSLSCKLPLTQSLNGITVGAGNYTEFRFNFIDLIDGTADIDLYQIKCEYGQISTPL